ncbi:unnamed protein product [Microthlaspi erraticum]|uniref:Uncharacterized protein n=1 Tax=Microthlaspi erraticum TaxID=1685480 RepID=A0A6D2HLI2_9BRAS|nr:unnamed protein product [Microthlaspi erraticum]
MTPQPGATKVRVLTANSANSTSTLMRQARRTQRFDKSRRGLEAKAPSFEEIEGFGRRGNLESERFTKGEKERRNQLRKKAHKEKKKKKQRVFLGFVKL